jgi:uncharacterized protein (UPF0332 family)
MIQARERAKAAREILAAGHLEVAVSVAYYAMLNAARAALSEDDAHSRTHRGTWHLFHDRYVTTGAFDEGLHALATSAQRTRERGDYEAITPDPAEASKVVEGASNFVDAIERMLKS